MNKKSPLLDKAAALLLRYLGDTSITRLPTVPHLARQAGVSVFTMSRAAQALAQEGQLVVLEGRGIWRPGCEPARSTGAADSVLPAPPCTKRERVTVQLERDIATGHFDHGTPLPSVKELCVRYNLSARGMKGILDALVSSRILNERKRSYHIRHHLHKPGKSAVVMMVDAPGSALVTARIQFNSRLIDEIEKQCRRQYVEFVLCPVSREDEGCSGGVEKKLRFIENDYAVLGYIVTGYFLANPPETIRRICAQKKPVAVVYEGRVHDEDVAGFPVNAHAFLFDSGGPSGALVAHHLLQLGHRSIAFVDYQAADSTRPDRLGEIQRVVTTAGGTVVVSKIDAAADAKIISCFEDAAREIAVRMERQHLSSPIDPALNQRILEKLRRNALGEAYRVNLHGALDRLFDGERFTAIVSGGETTPGFILEYLQLRKIEVPRQISLAGFGNIRADSEKGITSYDHDCFSVAHAIVWHILRPEQRKANSRSRLTVIEGVLMPRMSTGLVAG